MEVQTDPSEDIPVRARGSGLNTKEYIQITVVAILLVIVLRTFVLEAYKIPTSSMEHTLLPGDLILVEKLSYGHKNEFEIPFTEIKLSVFNLPDVSTPALNDVLVFKYPGDRDEFLPAQNVNYIKRIVGLPGTEVIIRNDSVFCDGVLVPSPGGVYYQAEKSNWRADRIFPKGKEWTNLEYGPLRVPKKGDVVELTPFTIEEWRVFINREFGRGVVSLEGGYVYIDGKPAISYIVQKNYYFVLGDNRDDSMDSRYWGFVPEGSIIGRAFMIYWSLDPSALSFLQAIRTERIFKQVH